MDLQQIKQRLSNVDWIRTGLAIVAIIAVCSALWNWYHPRTQTVTKTEYKTQTEEKVVEKIKRITVPGPERIVTIEKPVIVRELGLPQSVADDPNQQIVANAETTTEDGDIISSVAIMDAPPGQPATVTIIAKEKPQQLFGFPSNIEAGVRYGLSTKTAQEGNIFARWQFLRIGKVYMGAYGEITTQPNAKAMLEASFRF